MKGLTGYVATLDVLGFAELLFRNGYSKKLSTYIETINEVIRPTHVEVECVVFADSIVLTSAGNTEESFSGLITACAATFYELVMREMPVRGAIAFGQYWREATGESVFLAGRPIVEAYRAEGSQSGLESFFALLFFTNVTSWHSQLISPGQAIQTKTHMP